MNKKTKSLQKIAFLASMRADFRFGLKEILNDEKVPWSHFALNYKSKWFFYFLNKCKRKINYFGKCSIWATLDFLCVCFLGLSNLNLIFNNEISQVFF